ncbi:MAG: beta-1,6-galactofuranosyltransferase [Streptococcaceae bacterium]|nr:beta-1,6-galactofuranosyltransferase [Streptococcaceae bacterium]
MTYWITQLCGNSEHEDNTSAALIVNKNTANSAKEIGFEVINLKRFDNLSNNYERRETIFETLFSGVREDDIVVVQYPFYISNMNFNSDFIDRLKERKAKVVGLIHDTLTYLNEDYDVKTDFWFQQYRKFDLLLVANEKLLHRLKGDEIDVPMISMQIWDYNYSGKVKEKKFLKELYLVSGRQIGERNYEAKTPLHMIGKWWPYGFDPSQPSSIDVLGEIPSSQLLNFFEGGFGIVNTKNLLELADAEMWKRANTWHNPTKLSLYLASGLPVIVWPQSPHAEMIKKYGLGLVIDDLNDIDEILENMTEEDYNQMIENIKPWQKALQSGFFVKRALNLATQYLELGFDEGIVK